MLIEHQPWQFVSEQCPARALGRDPGGGGYPGQGRAANRTGGLRTAGLSKVQSVDERMRLNAVSAFANCGRAVARVRGSHVPQHQKLTHAAQQTMRLIRSSARV